MENIKELIELIEFEYGDCNCDSEKKCSYCKVMDKLKEWKEAARSEAEEVNRLQAENKKLREALETSIEGHQFARMVLREACFHNAADDMTDYIDVTMKALKDKPIE
jgi:hypothetical protein